MKEEFLIKSAQEQYKEDYIRRELKKNYKLEDRNYLKGSLSKLAELMGIISIAGAANNDESSLFRMLVCGVGGLLYLSGRQAYHDVREERVRLLEERKRLSGLERD